MDKLIEQISAIRSEMEELVALDSLTDEQETRFTELSTEFDELEATRVVTIERAEKVQAVVRAAEDSRNTLPAVDQKPTLPVPGARTEDPFTADVSFRSVEGIRSAQGHALRAVETDRFLTDDAKHELVGKIERYDMGLSGEITQHMLAAGSPTYRSAFGKAMQGQERLWTSDERAAVERAAMTLTDTAGGFAVPTTLDPTLVYTNDGESNPVRQLARKVLVNSDNWNGITTAGVTAAYKADNAESADGGMTLAQPTIAVHTADVTVPASIGLTMDWAGVAEEVVAAIVDAKDRLEGSVFVSGSGTNQPFGVVTAVVLTAGSRVAATTNDAFGLVDVYAVTDALPYRHRTSASVAWLADNPILNDVRQFGTNVANIWAEGIEVGNPAKLLGKPIFEATAMDGVIDAAQDNDVLLLGDFSRYVIADRVGLTVEFIPHLFATANNLPSGTRAYYAFWRNGADSIDDDAFRVLRV